MDEALEITLPVYHCHWHNELQLLIVAMAMDPLTNSQLQLPNHLCLAMLCLAMQ